MSKLKLLSLCLAVVMVLTVFSGSLVFAEPADEDNAVTTPAGDTADTGDTSDDETNDQPYEIEDGRIVYPKASLTEVDTKDEDNQLIVTAVEKVAEGRTVSIYTMPLSSAVAVEAGSEFVGLALYNGSDMKIQESFFESAYNYYDFDEDQISSNQVAYVLYVATIPEADLERLPEMDPAERLEWKKEKRGLYTSAEQRVRAMTKYYEDSTTILYADDELAEIAVYNKTNNRYFFSSPYDYCRTEGVSSTAVKSALASLVEITYYDNSANQKTVYSYTDAVAKTEYADENDEDSIDNIQFTSEAIENGVQFNLSIGTKSLNLLAPYAAEATNFETKVLQPLEQMAETSDVAKKALRKLKSYYRYYSYNDDSLTSSTKASLLNTYPGFKEYDLYVLRSDIAGSARQKQETADYIKLSGQYTWEDLNIDLERSGYVPDDQKLACFEVQVKFTIEDGNLVVDMPTDAISYDTDNFTMATVTLMRYFGCGTYDQDGFVFFPDGSGSVINFNTDGKKDTLSLSKTVYGDDYSLNTTTSYYNLTQANYMPVYGIKAGDQGYLAVLEKGDALATIKTETGHIQSAYETVYPTFVYNTVQTISYSGSNKASGSFTYFNKNSYTGGYRIRYNLLYGKNMTYVDMAKCYRQYLLDNGRLVSKVDVTNSNVPLVLETLGLIDKSASFYGIVYNKKIAMTTFEDAQSILQELMDNGVGNVSLRYRGWMNGGLNYSVPSKLKVESKLGGSSGLKDLISFMSDNNLTLFPEVDFCVVRRDGILDGYSTSSNSPKMTDRTTVYLTPRNELYNVGEIVKNYFAVSPASSSKYFKSFFNKYNNFNLASVSLGTSGDMLYSDFAEGKNATNRQQALDILYSNVGTYVTNQSQVMVEGGNAYTYGFATDIVDMPMCDSNNYHTDAAVPFMQIVLHGHVRYSGAALNLSDDMTDTILKSAEYGANLHFTLSAQNTRELKDTVYSNYYTIDFDTWKSDVISLYARFNEVFATLQDVEISDHAASEDADNVFITTYANGTRIAVNYNSTSVTVEGQTVPAQDFIVL